MRKLLNRLRFHPLKLQYLNLSLLSLPHHSLTVSHGGDYCCDPYSDYSQPLLKIHKKTASNGGFVFLASNRRHRPIVPGIHLVS